jgi:hypothetical protein
MNGEKRLAVGRVDDAVSIDVAPIKYVRGIADLRGIFVVVGRSILNSEFERREIRADTARPADVHVSLTKLPTHEFGDIEFDRIVVPTAERSDGPRRIAVDGLDGDRRRAFRKVAPSLDVAGVVPIVERRVERGLGRRGGIRE